MARKRTRKLAAAAFCGMCMLAGTQTNALADDLLVLPEITVTAKDDAAVGSVTITASVTYNDGQTAAQTASGTFTLSVTAHAMDYIAEIRKITDSMLDEARAKVS